MPRAVVRVLLVTMSDEELRSLSDPLHRERISVTRVRDLAAAVEALHGGAFDAAIVSHPLPDCDVIGSCAALQQVPGVPPVILLDALDPNEQNIPLSIRPARSLQKPVDGSKLSALVRELLEEPAPELAAPASGTAPLAFAAALLQLAGESETGVLEVCAGELHVRIFLRSGAPVSAEGGSLRETLGRMLLRRGDLAESDYVRVIERMTEKVMANEHQRMGEVLVELGLLSGDEVHSALEAQLFEKLTSCFQWTGSSWTFSELDELPAELEPFRLPPVEQLVLAGLQHHAPSEALSAWLAPHMATKPRLAQPAASLQERLALDAGPLRLLERVDGSRTLAVLARELPEAPALLAVLLLIDALELGTGAAASARPRVQVPFARVMVGRRRGATPSAAASADPPPDRAQSRLEAEQLFRRGVQLLDADKGLEAIPLLRRAIGLEPGEPEYALAEAWGSYLEARHGLRVARARAGTAARKLLGADPKAARAHSILGRIAIEDGDRERATREFELALLNDPQDLEAKRGLKQTRS